MRLLPEASRVDSVFQTAVPEMDRVRLTLVGVGAMNSPRFAPAGLLVECDETRVMIDGGPGAGPIRKVAAWLVTDERGELIREIRKLARPRGLEPCVGSYSLNTLSIKPHRVVHTSHNTYGYVVRFCGRKIVWAPEFLVFPSWAKNADLMFAEGAGWNRAILFRGGVGGHASVQQVARDAIKNKIKRLVFAHIGRPTIRALEADKRPLFGEYGKEGATYTVRAKAFRLEKGSIKLKGEGMRKRTN